MMNKMRIFKFWRLLQRIKNNNNKLSKYLMKKRDLELRNIEKKLWFNIFK